MTGPVTLSNKRPVAIVDIDGCLANNRHRDELIPPKWAWHICKAWNEYNEACGYDKPIKPLITYVNALADTHHIALLTARTKTDVCEGATLSWLRVHGVRYNRLFMREPGDNSPSHELKERYVKHFLAAEADLALAIDDEQANIDMFKSHNIPTLHVGGFNG